MEAAHYYSQSCWTCGWEPHSNIHSIEIELSGGWILVVLNFRLDTSHNHYYFMFVFDSYCYSLLLRLFRSEAGILYLLALTACAASKYRRSSHDRPTIATKSNFRWLNLALVAQYPYGFAVTNLFCHQDLQVSWYKFFIFLIILTSKCVFRFNIRLG